MRLAFSGWSRSGCFLPACSSEPPAAEIKISTTKRAIIGTTTTAAGDSRGAPDRDVRAVHETGHDLSRFKHFASAAMHPPNFA